MPMPSSDSLREAAVDRVAAQWIALGCQLAGGAETAVVDLEALVAITAEIGESSPRVYVAALDWCVAYGQAVNSARLKNVAAGIGVRATALAELAGAVRAAGGPRWPFALAGSSRQPRGKIVVADLSSPARLLWRVRSAFGVNARADILVALLTMPSPAVSISELARTTHFAKRNVAQAAYGMRLAGLVQIDRVGNEDRARIPPDSPLRPWLVPGPPPPCIDWPARWRVVLRAIAAAESLRASGAIVRAVESRAAIEPLLPLLNDAALPRPDLTASGAAFAGAFDAWLSQLEGVLGSGGR
jgi:hypothetical protein